MSEKVTMLTTVDNPYDPFEDFDLWYIYDIEKGYNSCAYLSRILVASDNWNEDSIKQSIEEAIDEIIKYDPFNIYTKVEKEIEDS